MRNRRIPGRWALALAAVFLFAGCENSAVTLNELYTYPREIWGEWVRVDTGDLWRFGSNWKATNNTVGNEAVYEKQSGNVLKITEKDGSVIYLFASRLPTASFSGKVAGVDPAHAVSGSRAIGIGGLQVQITNLNDRINSVVTQTDAGGNYTANDIVAGDDYAVTVGGETTNVTVNTNGDDVGTITIVSDGVNFKATLERRGDSAKQEQDMTLLWVGVTYYFNIVIENTGDENCLAPSYTLTPGPGIFLPNTKPSDELQSILPGTSKKIPIEIVCLSVDGESENKKIDIAIDSALDGRSWDDSVSLKFNREYVYLNIRSDGGAISDAVSGIVIVPGVKAYSFAVKSPSYQIRGVIPKYYEKDYLVVFSGASADTETYYSFNISNGEDGYQDAPSLSGFTDKTAGGDEPNGSGNGTEATATRIDPNPGVRAYLHINDIDFYKFSF
jgi:hypothetical protein